MITYRELKKLDFVDTRVGPDKYPAQLYDVDAKVVIIVANDAFVHDDVVFKGTTIVPPSATLLSGVTVSGDLSSMLFEDYRREKHESFKIDQFRKRADAIGVQHGQRTNI